MTAQYLKKCFGYSFWVALEVVAFVGLPRLVVFPVGAYLLGKNEFGLFLFALGIVMLLGKAPSVGLETGVIRHLVGLQPPAKDLLVSTGLRLCKIAMLAVVGLGIGVVVTARCFWPIDTKLIWCLIPLLILLYSWNLFELQMVRYRVERRFALRTAWYSILGSLLFIAILGALLGGAVGMAWGYALGFVIAHIILSFGQRMPFRKSSYDAASARLLKQVWFHVTVASVLAISSRYIYRIMLGVFHSYSDVAVLFGATNVVDLCLAPMCILGSLLLSVLGGFTRLEDVGRKQRYTVLAAGVSIAVGATLVVLFAGSFILSVMFPRFSGESARILRLIVMVIPCGVAILFTRPFVVKFGPIKFMPALNLITLLAHLVPGILLVPRFATKGAAISYNIGYAVSAVSYLAALAWILKFSGRYQPISEAVGATNGDCTITTS